MQPQDAVYELFPFRRRAGDRTISRSTLEHGSIQLDYTRNRGPVEGAMLIVCRMAGFKLCREASATGFRDAGRCERKGVVAVDEIGTHRSHPTAAVGTAADGGPGGLPRAPVVVRAHVPGGSDHLGGVGWVPACSGGAAFDPHQKKCRKSGAGVDALFRCR